MARNEVGFQLSKVTIPSPGGEGMPKSGGLEFQMSVRKAGASELLHFKTSHDLLKLHLTGPIVDLFRELTGIPLHVLWHQPFDFHKSRQALKLCPAVRNNCHSSGQVSATCQACLEQDWNLTAPPTADARQFIGPCGLTTFRLGLQAGSAPSPLTLTVQAKIKNGNAAHRPGATAAVSAAAFAQAVALLRVVHQDLAMTLRASVAEAALAQLQRRMTVLVRETTKQRQPFRRHPNPSVTVIQPAADARAPQIVREMVAYVHQHCHRPMSLGQLAAELKMNAAYLCDLFSRHLGVTFHHYLVEVRMAKARELLLDPRRRVCELACAVGYASADQFRHAFKAHAGVPPSAWR